MTNKKVTASTITVNKNNNKKRCTWISDEIHCAPKQNNQCFEQINCSSSRTNKTITNQLLGEHQIVKHVRALN